jgi:hypothetical protein
LFALFLAQRQTANKLSEICNETIAKREKALTHGTSKNTQATEKESAAKVGFLSIAMSANSNTAQEFGPIPEKNMVSA